MTDRPDWRKLSTQFYDPTTIYSDADYECAEAEYHARRCAPPRGAAWGFVILFLEWTVVLIGVGAALLLIAVIAIKLGW